MNNNDKILVSLTAGIAIGSVLGILLTRENRSEWEAKKSAEKIVKDLVAGLGKKHPKRTSLKEDVQQAVKEAFAESPEEYA